MLRQLSLRNARRQAKDYLVYFITMVISAALLFAFNSLVFSEELQLLGSQWEVLPVVIVIASGAVVLIIGWLVHYITGFMLKKRSKEFGIYMLLGIEHRKIASLFLYENMCIGAVAFFAGVPAGMLLYQIIRAVVLHAYGRLFQFEFNLSVGAVLLTVFYILIIYAFSLRKGKRTIRKMNIRNLLYYEKQNEKEILREGRSREVLFLVSILAGVISFMVFIGMAFIEQMQDAFYMGVGSVLCILFLYGFYISISGKIISFFEKKYSRKYKKQHLFLFRTLTSKITTMGVMVATLALLFGVTITAMGFGIMINGLMTNTIAGSTVYDVRVSREGSDEPDWALYEDYVGGEAGISDSWKYPVYEDHKGYIVMQTKRKARIDRMYTQDFYMRRSDYDRVRELLGYEAVMEGQESVFIHCMKQLESEMKGIVRRTPVPDGIEADWGNIYTEEFEQYWWNGNGFRLVIVAPDAYVEHLSIAHHIYAIMTEEEMPADSYFVLYNLLANGWDSDGGESFSIVLRTELDEQIAMAQTVIVLPLFYVSFILMIAAVTILVTQQLSDVERHRRQYQILSQLGMDTEMMLRVMKKQLRIYYGLPLIFPVVFGFAILHMFYALFGDGSLYRFSYAVPNILLTFGIFFFIYGIYVAASYISFKQMVLDE